MYRKRLRVSTGCLRCRQRHRKCDEAKPVCQACQRLSLACVWPSPNAEKSYCTPNSRSLGTFGVASPAYETGQLPVFCFTDRFEQVAIEQVPTLLKMHYTLAHSSDNRHASSLMQMIFSGKCVRSSLTACSLMLTPRHEGHKEAYERALGTALSAVQSKIGHKILDADDLYELLVAVVFLGLIESLGPDWSALGTHWTAMAKLVQLYRQGYQPHRWYRNPLNLSLVVLETMSFHSVLCMFLPGRLSHKTLWDDVAIFQLLTLLNPEDDRAINRSPFLAGQYRLYQVLHEIMLLFPSPGVHLMNRWIRTIQSRIRAIKIDLKDIFDKVELVKENPQPYLRMTYGIFITCLTVCITTLDKPSKTRDDKIKALTKEALQQFLQIQIVLTNHRALLWPVQILACAITDESDLQTLLERYRTYEPLLAPGPLHRAQSLFARIKEVRAQPVSEEEKCLRPVYDDDTFPRCMLLLRQKDGVLSSEF